ncbi:MAG TPA: phosphatidylglycerol lysyltransferase domain-containing protein, partial [Acidimicrobiales bacterium]
LTVEVPVGGRVVIMADLHLTADPGPAQVAATGELAAAVEAATGPGVLVVAGDLFDSGVEPGGALAAHSRLVHVIAVYAAGPGRRVIVLPGDRDARLAWSGPCQASIVGILGAELALAVQLSIHTGAGTRRVRVEPGHNLDALSRFEDPRNPRETPFAQHIREELLPSVRRHQKGVTGAGTGWLAGMEQLDDPAAISRFIASRLAYRRLGRSAWLLLVPVVVVVALRLPSLALRSARAGALSSRLGILVAVTVLELLLLVLIAGAALRRTTRALSALALDEGHRDPNDTARALARDLVTSGHAGLITAHTCRPELTHLGGGFYANAGCGSDVVTEVPSRLPGLGLPPIFLAHRETAWVELEAGNELHARLFHARQDLPGATLWERALANRVVSSTAGELRPDVVATFPQGQGWPRPEVVGSRDRRVRRIASLVVFAAGFVSLLSALAEPVRDRLNVLNELFPIAVPETAAALATLGGIGLMVLARGIRRGQRRAWFVCLAVLLAVAVLHLVKGVDVEEALVALAVAGYLWLHRASFEAKTDVARLGRGLAGVGLAAALTVVAGTLAVELGSWINSAHHPVLRRLSWPRAVLASLERMVGITHIALPKRLDEFFSPAMLTASAGLALALVAVLFRPVVRHRHHAAAAGAVLPAGAPVAGSPAASGAGGGGAGGAGGGLARARAVLARHGAGTLDYFALRPDKQFYFWGDTVVAHAVYGGVCLVSPDPIGPVAEREETWRAFRRYVDEHGWALGGLGAAEEWLPIYRATGMHDLYVGDEGVVRVGRFTLEGGRFKGLRQAVNRVAKYGYRISFHDPSQLDPALRAALEDVMTKSRRGDVERGFSMTLGRAFDPDDAGLLLTVVHGPADPDSPAGALGAVAGVGGVGPLGTPVAFCQFVPAPGIGGYSLDLMRRDDGDHPNGLIDFAVVETIREVKARGGDGLGLNFATMRAVLAGEAGEGLTQRVQAWVLRRMADSMQIESLWKFNAKFDPDWQPRYAVYDAPENMLAVAIAVARAESFWELPVIGRFLVPSAPDGGAGAA